VPSFEQATAREWQFDPQLAVKQILHKVKDYIEFSRNPIKLKLWATAKSYSILKFNFSVITSSS